MRIKDCLINFELGISHLFRIPYCYSTWMDFPLPKWIWDL